MLIHSIFIYICNRYRRNITIYLVQLIILMKSGFKDAPPTKKPLISGMA